MGKEAQVKDVHVSAPNRPVCPWKAVADRALSAGVSWLGARRRNPLAVVFFGTPAGTIQALMVHKLSSVFYFI